MNESIASLQKSLEHYDSIEDKLYFLERAERQTYDYYYYCGSNFSQEEANEYYKTWKWILDKLNCLKIQKASVSTKK